MSTVAVREGPSVLSGSVRSSAVVEGAANLHRHLGIVRGFGLPCVVAVNRRPGDTDENIADDPKAGTAYDFSGQPPRNQADE